MAEPQSRFVAPLGSTRSHRIMASALAGVLVALAALLALGLVERDAPRDRLARARLPEIESATGSLGPVSPSPTVPPPLEAQTPDSNPDAGGLDSGTANLPLDGSDDVETVEPPGLRQAFAEAESFQAADEARAAADDARAAAEQARAAAEEPPETAVVEEEPGVACGVITCGSGQVCCNRSCGICTEPGASCTKIVCGPVPVASSVVCGPNTCNVGQICCNPSCGICVSAGQSCDPTPCDNPPEIPFSVTCGLSTCNVGYVCCNASCGLCARPGETCDTRICD